MRALDEECKDAPAMERALLTNQVILLRTGPDFEPVRVKNIVSICLVEGDPYDDIHITDNEGKEYNIDSLSVTKDRQADDYLRFLEDLYGNTYPEIRFYRIDRNKQESPVARLRLWDYPLIFEVAAQSELLPCADAVLGILRREVAAGNMIIKVWNATHASFARHVMIRLRLGESTDYDGLTYDENGYRIWSSQERKHRVTIVFGDRTDDYAEYFCDLAREQAGLDFRLVRIIPRQKSIIVNRERIRIPVLGMLTLGDTYEKMIHGTKNASVSPSRSAELLPLWKKTAAHFWNNEMSEYYDSDMDLFVKRYEDICYMSFAYDQKRMVKDYLRERLPIPMHEVFASSAPGLHIVYGRAEYEKMRIGELQEELREEIREMARKYVASVYGFPMECDFSVTFWHREMENYNGYGLARQD
ncbi:MAG: hypothetical protein IJR00_06995 [Lachnospiraceae bacterium]|nr:hypothetical protein [Lachnospiraceae bacterium]